MEGEEGEEEPELAEEKLDTDEALDRKENVDSLCFLLTGSLFCLVCKLTRSLGSESVLSV